MAVAQTAPVLTSRTLLDQGEPRFGIRGQELILDFRSKRLGGFKGIGSSNLAMIRCTAAHGHGNSVNISFLADPLPLSPLPPSNLSVRRTHCSHLFSPIGNFICNRIEKNSSVRKPISSCFYPGFFSRCDKFVQCLRHSRHIFDPAEKLLFPELQPHFFQQLFLPIGDIHCEFVTQD